VWSIRRTSWRMGQIVKRLYAQTEINASAERVWQVLTEVSAYTEWNPFMTQVTGEARVGARLEARLEPPAGKARIVRLKVVKADPPRELRWVGRFPMSHLPGLFQGERMIRIEPLAANRVRVTNRTTFKGLLVPFVGWLDACQPGFDDMNRALKARAEAG
jgi:hypothetical protein